MNIFEAYADAFARNMRDLVLNYNDDPEILHVKMDDLMCETLENFGCCEGVKIFKATKKWYA